MSECVVNDEFYIIKGYKAKDCKQGAEYGCLFKKKVCLKWGFVCTVCVCQFISCWITKVHLASYPLDFFSTSHHSNFPAHKPPVVSTFIFCVCLPPSTAYKSELWWSQLCLFIFFRGCCYQVKQIQQKVNLFSSTTSPITEWTTDCFESATLWLKMVCNLKKNVILTCSALDFG